jgi:pyruvate dehydrogenase E1 component
MFTANGWTVVEAKYGSRLCDAFTQPRGDDLRRVIDQMSNEQYQLLLRSPAERIAEVLGDVTPDVRDDALTSLIADLGGHDFGVLREALARADAAEGPAVLFAYTVKGWGLRFAGDPLNHSALLTNSDITVLRQSLGISELDEWQLLPHDSAGGRLAAERSELFKVQPRGPSVQMDFPDQLAEQYSAR